ncbi:hypothetical protein BN1088_1430443 [Sphingobacterium sp. PM2-P1-29]|nr:hypothetical protein BN1088_1430443 [Sphingobacterium sp. PM2-P1-29]
MISGIESNRYLKRTTWNVFKLQMMRFMWITKNLMKCVHVSKESIYIRFNLGGVGCLKSFLKNEKNDKL